MKELSGAPCLANARAVWSMWPGYLDEPRSERLVAFLAEHDIPIIHHHSSGHAYIPDLQRLVTALAPRRVVPVHSFAPAAFARYFHARRLRHRRKLVGGVAESACHNLRRFPTVDSSSLAASWEQQSDLRS